MIRPASPFAVATLAPVPLLLLGAFFGGIFILAAFLYLTLLRMILDGLVATAGPEAAPGVEFPAADRLLVALGALHFPLLIVGVAAVSGKSGLNFLEGFGALLAFGLYFGQVSNSAAHELIHRTDKRLFRLGKWILISLLYGHHVTAHLRVHHRFVATPDDPNTAAAGEGFYGFAVGAWLGAFLAGWEIENSISKIKGKQLSPWRHPYAEYVGGALGVTLLSVLLFGFSGLIAFLLLAGYAQMQLLLSDYVQHYGLRRRRIDDDRFEAVAPWHSWNAPHWFSAGLMLNAPRHSEHHVHPATPYPELSLPHEVEGPRLPYSLPVMGAVALLPPVWRRLMDRRSAAWQKRIDEGEILRSRTPAPLPAPARPSRPAKAPEGVAVAEPAVPAEAAVGAGSETAAKPASAALEPGSGAAEEEVFLRQIAEAEASDDEVEATPPAGNAKAEPATSRTTELWGSGEADKDDAAEAKPAKEPKAGTAAASFVRSSSLFQDELQLAGEAEPEDLADAESPVEEAAGSDVGEQNEAVAIENSIAKIVAGARKEERRRRAKFPTLEPSDERKPASTADQLRTFARSAAIASRALAAVLRGAPGSRHED